MRFYGAEYNNIELGFASFFVAVPQIFDSVKSVALWSAKKIKIKKDHKGLQFHSYSNP
jgi:hypothetical protein